jgi:hypothetical protein
MYFSPPSLHPPLIASPDHRTATEEQFSLLVRRRPERRPAMPTPDSLEIPLTTVSLNSNFDAYIDIWFKGSPAASAIQLVVDSGNSMLVVPRWEDIAALPHSSADYVVLGAAHEPWGCPANVVRGPIDLATASGDPYRLEDCVFYACTGEPSSGRSRTANFGAGCISPWTASGWNKPAGIGVTMQAPLSYKKSHPYVEFNYAPAASIYGAANTPRVAMGSYLKVYKEEPPGHHMFDVSPDLKWMSLTPKALSIGGAKTLWPGTVSSPIAMIDTGGGPVFLSDPNGCVYNTSWPDPVANPTWTSHSVDCQSTSDFIAIELGDSNRSISYKINTSDLPSTVQGLTLVMCKLNSFMMGEQGMNIGGISALVNYILVDYHRAKVGLKPKLRGA